MLVGWVGWANVCFALCTQSGECRDVESRFLRQKLQVASSVLCSLKSETAAAMAHKDERNTTDARMSRSVTISHAAFSMQPTFLHAAFSSARKSLSTFQC